MAKSTRPNSELSMKSKQYSAEANAGLTKKLGLKIGKIVSVKPEDNTADIEWLWPTRGGNSNVSLSRPYVGFRSGIHFVPEVGSQVIVGYSKDEIVLLSYLMPSDFKQLVSGANDSKNNPTRMRVMSPGEISLNSSMNSEIYLKDTLIMKDSKNNNITIDPTFGITLSSSELTISNEAGSIRMGAIRRADPTNGSKIITEDGLPWDTINGGVPLTEFVLDVKRTADGANLTSDNVSPSIATITIGNKVNEFGYKVVNQDNKEIVCEIKIGEKRDPTGQFAINPGMKIQVDIDGNLNINGGNMLTPIAEIPAAAERLTLFTQKKSTDYTTGTHLLKSQQRAAREGDEIKIPLSALNTDIATHPELAIQGGKNQLTLATWFPTSCFVMGIPVLCVPWIPVNLLGTITNGADGVFIGDKPKSIEL